MTGPHCTQRELPLNKHFKKSTATALLELLEARILFSADGFAVGVGDGFSGNVDFKPDNLTPGSVLESALRSTSSDEVSHQISQSDDHQLLNVTQAVELQVVELIVIDLAVDDLESLLDQIAVKPHVTFEFLTLEPGVNGIDKIEQFLNDHGPVDAIHIISHGADGVVELGDVTLTNDSLELYQSQLQGWSDLLAADADILFYGCDLAASDQGRLLIDSLAIILDSDVAASDDTTGHQSLGGNWVLEYNTGVVNTGLFLSDAGVQSFESTLDISTGLVGHWEFELNLDDSVGGNHAVFALAGGLYAIPGATGSAYAAGLDNDAVGLSNYLQIPNSTAYDFGTGDFSIAFWYKTAKVGSAEEMLVGKLDSVEIYTQNTDELVVNVGGGAAEIVAPSVFKRDSLWHHVAVVRDAGELTLYTDGIMVGGPVADAQDISTPHPYLLGATSQTTNDYDGNLDDVRIYDRPLSVDDVYEVMGSVAPSNAPTLTAFSTPVETTTLNTEVEITFAELLAAGNEADDIGVTNYQITAVSNGTLRIGADSTTAVPLVVGSNDTISVTKSAFWTPDNNVSGILNAFEVVAVDGQAAVSTPPLVAQVEVLNSAPTMTSFSSDIDITNVNTEQEISFAEIAARANESDLDGVVVDFRIASVLSGSLRIGVNSATATAFSAGVNDTINTTNKAFWTPDSDVIGTFDAFELVAVDDDAAESVPAVTASVSVVNQIPTLTSFATFAGFEDTELEITYGQMIGFGNESDVDGTVERFVVESVSTGSLLIGATSATAMPFAPGSNDIINPANRAYWTPAANENGVVNSFSVKAEDKFGAQSSTPVVVPVDVAPVSDPPVGGDRVISVTNDTSHTFNLYDFTFSDPIDGDTFTAVRIDTLPANGQLELLGSGPVQAGEIIQVADIASGNFVYSPVPGAAADTTYDSFTFSVGDDGIAGPNFDVTPNEIRVVLRDGIVGLSGGIELNNDGGNDAYLIADNPLGFDASEFTWEVKLAKEYTTEVVVLASYATSQNNNEFFVALAGPTDLIVIFGDFEFDITGIDYRTALLDGKLHSLSFTWNSVSGSWVTYIDGVLVDQGRQHVGAEPNFSSGKLVLGQEQDSVNGGFDSSQVFSGTMYDMRFWDRVLQPTEVNSYHKQKLDPANLPANLVANWQMDGFNANNKVVDVVSGNNLSIAHASGGGFVPSEVKLSELHVDENSPSGTQVGYVVPVDQAGTVNLVQDASFTEHGYARNQAHFSVTGSFGAWDVVSGNIDIAATDNTYPSPVNGDIIDLSGSMPGTIRQVINTIPGVEYELKFLMAANGNSGADNIQSVRVTADTESQIINHELDTEHWSTTNPLWSKEGFRFVASSSTAEIRFQSLENNNRGPLLAHVEVREVPPSVDAILSQNPGVTYDPTTDKFYQPVYQAVHYPDAYAAASSAMINGVPGQLISLDNQHADNYLGDLAASTGRDFWTSGSDAASEGVWTWANGEQFWQGGGSGYPVGNSYTNWNPGGANSPEPNSFYSDENYLVRRPDGWNDVRADNGGSAIFYYVIEWDAHALANQYQFEFSSGGNGDANGRFAIDKDTGEITVADGSLLDYEADAFHDVDVRVTDEMGHSYTETIRIDVCDINEPPNGIDKAVTINEDSVYTFSTADFPLQADAESDALLGVIINTLPGAGALLIGTQSVAVGQSLALSQIDTLSYVPAQNDSGVYSFEFSVIDDGGVDGSGIDTDLVPNTFTITVAASNDEPIGTTGSIDISEDQTRTFSSGDFGFIDPVEGDNFLSVIIANTGGLGDFTFNGTALLPNQEVLVSDIDSGLLQYTPAANVNGSASAAIAFQVRDDGGVANSGVDTDRSANALTINILSVNDAPAGTDGVMSLLEDETAIITAAHFGFTDSKDNNLLSFVVIDSLPINGTLELNGVAVTVGQPIGFSDLQANDLTYTPNNNLFGVALDQIQFRVRDDGGRLNGGADTDPVANTLQFNVTSVNDEPDINDRTIFIDEDQTYQFALSNFNIIDVDNNNLLDVTIDTLPALGSLSLGGNPVVAGDVIPAAQLNNLTFTPAPDVYGASFTSFTIIVRDNGGVANAGVDLDSTANTIVFSSNSVNDAPVSANFTSTLNEDSVHAYQLNEFIYSDLESDVFTELLITSLPSSGVLALNNVPVALGQAIAHADISQLTYTPPVNAAGSLYDGFTFRVKDDGGTANNGVDTSAQYTAFIDIVPVNDPPIGADFTVSTNEDTAYSFSASQFAITDIENHSLNAIIINSLPSSGVLTLGGSALAPGQIVSANSISNLVYTPNLNINGMTADLFTFQIVDNGGVLNGGSDTDATQNTVFIDVLSVNDAPVGGNDVVTILEDTSHTFSAADFGFTDVDNDIFQSITIQLPPTNGTLSLSGSIVTAGQVINVSQLGNMVFTPQPNTNQAPYDSFTFLVTDDGGTANGGVDTDTIARSIIINVGSMNDAPTGANVFASTFEDTAYSFSDSDFGFTDSDNNNLSHIIINSLPVGGSLELSGIPIVPGQIVLASRLTDILYTPAPDAFGSSLDSFDFHVVDDGGTDNGGLDTALQANTWSIDVLSVNDAPLANSTAITTAEDTSYSFSVNDFGFSDSDNNVLDSVIIQTLPVNGQLVLGGVPVAIGQLISSAAINNLSYLPALNGNGSAFDSFEFAVQDNGGITNGGDDTSNANATLFINVTAVNDAPQSTDKTIAVLEDTPYSFSAAEFDMADVEGHGLQSIIITALPAQGQLSLNGIPVTVSQVISDTAISDLLYTPPANAYGAGYASLAYRIQDDGGTANGGQDTSVVENIISIDLLSVNDAPQAGNTIVSTIEDTAYQFSLNDIGFTDSDSNTLQSVTVATLPVNGGLYLAGVPVALSQTVVAADISQLEYVPDPHANGVALDLIDFVVVDNGGTSNGGTDTAGSFSQVQVDVISVNDPPIGSDALRVLVEDSSHVLSLADFGFSDIHDSNALQSVRIDSVPANGLLELAGLSVVSGQLINSVDLIGGDLVFTPTANTSGLAYSEFQFSVIDNGGIANGGLNTDLFANTLTFDVLAVNDPPQSTDQTITTTEDTDYVFSAADFDFSDPEDLHAFDEIIIDTLPGSGALLVSGVELVAGQSVSVTDLIAGDFIYRPLADVNGLGLSSFMFRVQDNGPTDNGGSNLSLNSNTISIDVLSVNDAPQASNTVVSTLEDTPYQFSLNDIGFTDSDSNSLQSVTVATLPTNGGLYLAGVPVALNQAVVASDVAMLEYVPDPNANGLALDYIDFIVVDNGGTNNGGVDTANSFSRVQIDVVSVNDPPLGADTVKVLVEDSIHVLSIADFGYSDIHDSNALQFVRIDSLPANGQLALAGVPAVAGQLISSVDLTSGDLAFTPTANSSGLAYSEFQFSVIDDGGITNGGFDTDLNANTLTFDVLAVNDPPQSADQTITTTEDTDYIFSAADFVFSDTADLHALDEIIIETLPGTGALMLSGVELTAGQSVSVTDLLSANLVYRPATDLNGSSVSSFLFRVQDNGQLSNGGNNLSVDANTITIDVLTVNDAPQAGNTVVSTNEDTPYQFSLNDIGFTDSDSDELQSVTVAKLPTNGELYLAGVPVALNQLVLASDISLLEYVPDPHANSVAYDQIDFLVVDSGGTNNGGVDTADSFSSVQIDVISVNDPPLGSDALRVLLEDSSYVLSLTDFGFSDIHDTNALQSIRIDSLPANGQLALAGVPVVASQLISSVDLVSGDLLFTPAANASALGYSEFQFSVIDDGGIANGGLNVDQNPNSITFDVVSVNDPPQSADQTITATEDTDYIFSPVDFSFSDPDLHTLDEIIIETLPDSGALILSGIELEAGQSVNVIDLLSAEFVYRPLADVNGMGVASFMFRVQDNGPIDNGGNNRSVDASTITIDVHAINDAPQMLLTEAVVNEGSETLLDTTLISTVDLDDSPLELLLTLESGPQNGVLLLNGAPMSSGTTFTVEQLNNNEVYYVHNGSETSVDSFMLSLRDGGENNTPAVFGEFAISVNDVIDPIPELINDTRQVEFGKTTIAASVIDNDTLLSPDSHTITIETQPENGIVTINNDGTFSYTHNGEDVLTDSFSYRVTNSDDLYQIATVTIEVEPEVETAFEVPFEELLIEPPLPAEPVVDLEADNEEELIVEQNAEVEVEPQVGPESIISELSLPEARAEINESSSSVDSVVLYAEQQVETNFIARLKLHEIKNIGVQQHNRLDVIALDAESKSKARNLLVNLEVKISDLRDVTDNYYFQDALARIDNELSEADTERNFRTVLGTEAVFGVSISATAGVLAWALRGGALFASMMAATPLWSSIDPVRVLVGKSREDENEPQDSVERVFD